MRDRVIVIRVPTADAVLQAWVCLLFDLCAIALACAGGAITGLPGYRAPGAAMLILAALMVVTAVALEVRRSPR